MSKPELKLKIKMNKCSALLMMLVVLKTLPCTTLSIPNGDPAPGRSPGPPAGYTDVQYETTTDMVTEEADESESETFDACAFAKVSTDNDRVVTVTENDSEVNLTVSHAVFETDELVRGVVYEVVLITESDTLRDYALYSVIHNFIKGNFTPSSHLERSCDDPAPHFVPKHSRVQRSKRYRKRKPLSSDYRTLDRTKYSDYYFKPKSERVSRSIRYRRRFPPARVVTGPLGRRNVTLQWSLTDSAHLDNEDTSVVFRLRYRSTTSATIYQVFFTKILRLECALRLRPLRAGRVHSGHVPRSHGCRLLIPQPSLKHALLVELHKLNVPCAVGFIRFAPNTPILCGKLDQIPTQNRRFIYNYLAKNPAVELHGRPPFAATYRVVDHCYEVVLTERNGSFDVGPTTKLFCSYKIHLPYGNRVALRLQMGTGPIVANQNEMSNIIQEDNLLTCRGMELSLEDTDSKWRHCSQPADPLRSVQIVSEGNSIRLNISVLAKRNSNPMWLKVWWMDKPIDDIVDHCDYGWVVSGDFCVTAVREAKKAWRQAETECVRLGGHLASVLSERQQRILDNLLIHAPGAGVHDVYWIGATDVQHEGEFRWSDGFPFTYSHWFPGWRKHSSQPNDDGTSGQDCVEVRREFPPRPLPAEPSFMWNDRGCREHNYFVCERPRIEDAYITSSLQCNETIVLSRSHPHAIVTSPGFPRPYPDDVLCTSELRAPPAHTLLLHFEELLTEHEPHCSYDYLEIKELDDNSTDHPEEMQDNHHGFDSANDVFEEPELLPASDAISAGWVRGQRTRLCGDWGGKLKLLRYQSKSNIVIIRFRADHSRHYAGYKAKITVSDSLSCSDVKQTEYNGHCYLFAGHPRAAWATAKQTCEGLNMLLTSILSTEEERFIMTGIRQSSDYSAGVVYWLGGRGKWGNFSWVDGSPAEYQSWATYNDTEDAETCLGVQWVSSPVLSQSSGLQWALHKCTLTGGYVCKRKVYSEYLLHNRTVEGSSGEISSPNYPNMYDNDLDYWISIVGSRDTRLVVVFRSIDLEFQKDCLYDYIELIDGESGKASRYCGTVGETRWVASSNTAELHFRSDYNTQGSGFSLTWRAVEQNGCPSQTFTSKEGIIQSPNYPHFLLPNLDCTIDVLAPAGKRVFLNISFYDFGYGTFLKGVPLNVTDNIPEDNYLEIQIDTQNPSIRPFQDSYLLTNGLFVSRSEVLRLRLKTGESVAGKGFFGVFKTTSYVNATHVIELGDVRAGRLSAVNWPASPPLGSQMRTRLLAPLNHTLSVAFANTRPVVGEDLWPCGEGNGWIEVKDSYSDYNGTQWILCEENRSKRKLEPNAPLVINSYLHSLTVTQCSGDRGVNMDVSVVVNKDPDYYNKVLLISDDTNLESCYPNPCLHEGRCVSDNERNFCQCPGFYTGAFCLVSHCERSPCVFGNCSASGEGWACACARGWRGRRCAERERACSSRPCNARGACSERDGSFICQCNPSWKGKRCEIPNPTPKIVSLGARMLQEPFWLGLIAVFVVMSIIGLVWCAKRHFPEKIEKLLAEEADRCARPSSAGAAGSGDGARALLTRLGIRKPSGAGLAGRPRAARTFSLDDLLKPPPTRSPSPRKKRNNSTPTKKNIAEKKQILQQLISPASGNDHSKKISMGELIQMSEKRPLSTVESAPAFVDYGVDNKETSFASEGSSPSTSPSMRHISDPKLEKKVTFARLLNRVSAEMSSSSEVDMVNTIAIPMAVIANRGVKTKASSTPPSPAVEVRSPHSTSSNQGSDSMSSLDFTLASTALKKNSRTPKISSADSILAMFRNFSSSSAAMASRASSAGVSQSSTPTASSPQDDDADDISISSSLVPSLAPDSPVARPHHTIEIQVLDPLSAHKSPCSGNLLHPPSILLEVPSSINKCLSPIRELPTPLPTPIPTPLPTPLPSPRMPRAKMDSDVKRESATTCVSPSEDELDEIKVDTRSERIPLRLKLRQYAVTSDTPTPSTHVADSPSPSFTHSQDSEREMSSPSPAPPALTVPVLTIERPSPGSPPPRRTPPHLEFQPPPLITVTYNASEESDEPLSPRPPPPSGGMCYLSPFAMVARGDRAPSESNLSSSGYSSMASPGPSRCGSSNPLCPSEMEDPGSGGGPSCFRRRPLMKTNSSPAASNDDTTERRRGRSDSETLSDDPLLESNDEGIGTDERVDDVPSSAKEMETLVVLKENLDVPQTNLCSPSGVTKCSIVKCISVERGLDEKASLRPPIIHSDCSRPLSPVSSRSESPLSDKTGLGRFSPHFYGRQLPFTDSDGLYDFPSSDCVKNNFKLCSNTQKKSGRKRDRKTTRTVSHEVAGTAKSTLPHMPHSMHNLLEVPGCRDTSTRSRKGGRRRSRSQAPAPPSSSSSEDSASAASVASVASARELRLPPDVELQPSSPTRLRKPLRRQKCRSSEDTSSKISSSLDLTEDLRKPAKVSKLKTISNQIRFLRRLERSLKMKETFPALSDDEGDESSSVTSPLLQARKDLCCTPGHAISAPLLTTVRPKIARQRRYDRSLVSEETKVLNPTGNDNSD